MLLEELVTSSYEGGGGSDVEGDRDKSGFERVSISDLFLMIMTGFSQVVLRRQVVDIKHDVKSEAVWVSLCPTVRASISSNGPLSHTQLSEAVVHIF